MSRVINAIRQVLGISKRRAREWVEWMHDNPSKAADQWNLWGHMAKHRADFLEGDERVGRWKRRRIRRMRLLAKMCEELEAEYRERVA